MLAFNLLPLGKYNIDHLEYENSEGTNNSAKLEHISLGKIKVI
jgi:hypothetical protein